MRTSKGAKTLQREVMPRRYASAHEKAMSIAPAIIRVAITGFVRTRPPMRSGAPAREARA